MRLPLTATIIIDRAIRTKRPVRIDDLTSAEGIEDARFEGVRALVGTPVLVEGRVWGVMTAASLRPEPLPAGTEFRLGALRELVAMAIANAEARRELEQAAAEQAALRRIATLVAEVVPPGEVFTAVAEEAAGLFGVPLVGLFRYETEGVATIIAGAGQGSSLAGRRWTFPVDDPSVVASLQRTGQPLRIDDYTPVEGAVTAEARELGITAAAGVPVIVNGRTWGSLELAAGQDHLPLPADTLDRLAAFTDLVATAIANSDARTEIERLAEEQAALRRVATLVAQGEATGEVFAAVAREVSEVMHLPVAAVQRFEEDGETATLSSRNPVSRNATITTACASVASVLRPCPVSNTRALAANLAGTSSTRSPSASSRCATGRPTPPAPSTAHTRSGHCRANRSIDRYPVLLTGKVPVARSTSRPSRASIVTDRLCGSIPITIRSTSRPPRLSSIPYWRGRATLFRAEQTLLEPRLTAAPGRPHAMKEPHPTRGGQPREERTYPVPTRD
jgi:GAF domain-containing protein